MPDPGQSLFDIIASSGSDPTSFVGLESAAPYVEKLQFDAQKIKLLSKTYILYTESEFTCVTHIAKKKIEAAGKECVFLSYRHPTCQWLPCRNNSANYYLKPLRITVEKVPCPRYTRYEL